MGKEQVCKKLQCAFAIQCDLDSQQGYVYGFALTGLLFVHTRHTCRLLGVQCAIAFVMGVRHCLP